MTVRVVGSRRDGAWSPVTDLRNGRADEHTGELWFTAGDVVVVSGLPGSGKSVLIRRAAAGRDAHDRRVRVIDSQNVRLAWEERLPVRLPYALYRPGVRVHHYLLLERALRSGDSVVVHDCGTNGWVRRWAAARTRRRGSAAHLVLLDVAPVVAMEGQHSRGRTVPLRAFDRHRRAVGRLIARVTDGGPPEGCASAVLLDRRAARALRAIGFG